MSGRVKIAPGDRVSIDGVELEFVDLLADKSGDANTPDQLHFVEVGPFRYPHVLTRADFDALYTAGKVVWKTAFERKEDAFPEEQL